MTEKKDTTKEINPNFENDNSVETKAARLLRKLNSTEMATSVPSLASLGLSGIAGIAIPSLASMGGITGALPTGAAIEASLGLMTYNKTRELNETIEKLRKEVDDKAMELNKTKLTASQRLKIISELESKVAEISDEAQFSFLLTRVNDAAKALLLSSTDFRKQFLETVECDVFVMSVDIRRSTELMLKARSPQQFANFITTLCRELESVVKEHFGVFDKFTGDGILAFFPDFFSGEDAGYNIVAVADKCHRIFYEKYKEFRTSFTSILTDVGLGIGIDYGPAHMVQMAGGLTVVGSPVVYACRLGGAPAGITLLNQPAYEKVTENFSEFCFVQEAVLDIKNEGKILAYEINLNSKGYQSKPPSWLELLKSLTDSPKE